MRLIEEIVSNKRIFRANTKFINTALVKLTDSGTCTVAWGYNECGFEHVSVSPLKLHRIPSWNDMCQLKDIFFYDDEEVLQLHPKKSEYVNIQDNCLHLWKPKGIEIMETLGKIALEVRLNDK